MQRYNGCMNQEPESIDISQDGGIHHLEDTGVTKGINFLNYHVFSSGGKHLMTGTALGKRNLEFRRAEATSGGWHFKECAGDNCNHESPE